MNIPSWLWLGLFAQFVFDFLVIAEVTRLRRALRRSGEP